MNSKLDKLLITAPLMDERTIKEEVSNLSLEELCILKRFAPTCDGWLKIQDEVYKRVEELGGMTPEISKKIGWDA